MSVEALRALALSVRNWGRWGPDDEIGTLNYITPDTIAAASRLAAERPTTPAPRMRTSVPLFIRFAPHGGNPVDSGTLTPSLSRRERGCSAHSLARVNCIRSSQV